MKFFCLFFIFLSFFSVNAQDFPYTDVRYAFIDNENNKLLKTENAVGLDRFFKKWAGLIKSGDQQIKILHLGDSHIQADFLTGRIRSRIQQFFPGSEGARGIIFPYNLAGTNNPGNYFVNSENQWEVVNGVKQDNFSTGIIPAKVICGDSVIKLNINQIDDNLYSGFDRVEIWYACQKSLTIEKPVKANVDLLPGNGRVIIDLDDNRKKTEIVISGANDSTVFELFGIGLFNDFPGITYHALGLNGATTADFLKCEYFEKYLSYTSPDLIIISLGTNDMYDLHARIENFATYYNNFLQRIRNVFPKTAMILTTPGDHFIYGYLPNNNLNEASKVINQIAGKYEAAVWDFYNIMGGHQSMRGWDMNGLSAKDRIHLSRKGYYLQADLFFNAILKNFEKRYLNSQYFNAIKDGIPFEKQK
jgi:lysophospholipase L1-like esterase